MTSAARDVLAYAASNGGVVTRAEALAMGMGATTIKDWVTRGHLVRVGNGVYVLPGVLRDERTLLEAATRALGAVASHESAARLHGLDGLDPTRCTVTVPIRRSNRFNGVIVHQSTDLTEDEVVTIDGIPCTDPPRTLIDLAAVLPTRSLAELVDDAARRGLATYQVLSDRLEDTARRGKPGVRKMRLILRVRLGGDFVSDSTMETRTLGIIEAGGLPLPTSQFHAPWLRRVNGRVDLAYVAEKVLVECDSLKWHGSPEAFQMDRHRDNLALLAGWTPLRFTWEDITKRPSYVVSTIRAALERAWAEHAEGGHANQTS